MHPRPSLDTFVFIMDTATQILLSHMRALRGPTLWLVDEHIDDVAIASISPRENLFALGNRCDVIAALSAQGINAVLNDFDIAAMPSFQHVAFRVAKEKALVHYAINTALEQLPVGGTLALSGYKNDGAKTYIEKAAARAGGELTIERDSGALLGVITRGNVLGGSLPDQNYAQPQRIVLADDFTVWSKPGIFGWQKIDAGSAFLCEHLAQVWPQTPPQRVLDLGCGYGYLTLRAAAQWPHAYFFATDNNIAATKMCARNMHERSINGQVECSDCGEYLFTGNVRESFDAILCNPPFHQGFAHERALTEKFLQHTKRLLARGGRALFVVNQFIGLEKIAESMFKRVEIVARNKSFKLIMLEN